jgi:hypothetical protein
MNLKESVMEKRKNARAILWCSAFTLLAVLAGMSPHAKGQVLSQDLTMRSITTSSGMADRGDGYTSTEYYSKSAMKIHSSDGNDSIIRFDSERIITIDHKRKTYTDVTFKQLQEALSKVGSDFGADAKQMEAMKKVMGQMAESFTVTKEGPGESIAGYSTEKYLIKGPMEMEIWAAEILKIPAAYYDLMKLQAPSNPMFDMKKLYEEMKKVDGFPLKTVMTMKMMDMEIKTTKVVTSIEEGALPASVFEIPAGYKLVNPK